MNALYYTRSPKGKLSMKAVRLLERLPFANEFIKVEIDKLSNDKEAIRNMMTLLNIKTIPTLYVDGRKYDGEYVFLWLQNQFAELQGGGQQPPYGYQQQYGDYQQDPYGQQQQPWMGQQPGFQSQFQNPVGGQQMYQPSGGFQSPGRAPDQTMMMDPVSGFGGSPGVGGIGSRHPMQGQYTGGQGMPPMMPQMPDGREPFQGNPNISAGQSGMGGASFDSQFSSPFEVNSITGQVGLRPIETKHQDNSAAMDAALQQYANYRDASVVVPSRPMGVPPPPMQQQQQYGMQGGFGQQMPMMR